MIFQSLPHAHPIMFKLASRLRHRAPAWSDCVVCDFLSSLMHRIIFDKINYWELIKFARLKLMKMTRYYLIHLFSWWSACVRPNWVIIIRNSIMLRPDELEKRALIIIWLNFNAVWNYKFPFSIQHTQCNAICASDFKFNYEKFQRWMMKLHDRFVKLSVQTIFFIQLWNWIIFSLPHTLDARCPAFQTKTCHNWLLVAEF